jgi:hypothetical protein
LIKFCTILLERCVREREREREKEREREVTKIVMRKC